MSLYDYLGALESLADKDCNCTPEQQTGEDPSRCQPCIAAEAMKRITDIARNSHSSLFPQITVKSLVELPEGFKEFPGRPNPRRLDPYDLGHVAKAMKKK